MCRAVTALQAPAIPRGCGRVWGSEEMETKTPRLPRCAVAKNPANAGDAGLAPESGRSPGVGNDNPSQYFLASMDRGAWWATSPWDHKESDAAKQLSTHTWALNPRDYTVRLPRKTPLLLWLKSVGPQVSQGLWLRTSPSGNSPAVQWLGLRASPARSVSLIPDGGTKILWVMWHNRKQESGPSSSGLKTRAANNKTVIASGSSAGIILNLKGRCDYHSHFINEETEAQRG